MPNFGSEPICEETRDVQIGLVASKYRSIDKYCWAVTALGPQPKADAEVSGGMDLRQLLLPPQSPSQ